MDASEKRSHRKPKSRMRQADRKRQLMFHAKQLFVTLGYLHTTTEKIAQAADVTEPVLYSHFESKKSLFLEVLDDIRRTTLHRWRSETATIVDPFARLQAMIGLYLASAHTHVLEFHIIHRSLVETDDADISKCLLTFYLDSEKLLVDVIREGQKTGVFRTELDPRVGAWELIRNGLGYTLTLPLAVPVYQEDGYIERATACMLQCLRT